jgi:hypothetical protein
MQTMIKVRKLDILIPIFCDKIRSIIAKTKVAGLGSATGYRFVDRFDETIEFNFRVYFRQRATALKYNLTIGRRRWYQRLMTYRQCSEIVIRHENELRSSIQSSKSLPADPHEKSPQ